MIIWLFLGGIALTIILRRARYSIKENGGNRFVYHLCDKTLDFLYPLIAVTGFFLLMTWIFDETSDSASLLFLIKLEAFFGGVKSFLSKLRLGPAQTIGILIVVYAINLLRLPSKLTSGLLPFFRRYRKTFTTIFTIATLLCLFTFFGTQLDTPLARLKLRIDDDKKGYAELRKKVQEAISAQIPSKLYQNALTRLPPSYPPALLAPQELHRESQSLQTTYARARGYGIDRPEAGDILRQEQLRESWNEAHRVQAPLEVADDVSETGPAEAIGDAREISGARIQASRKTLDSLKSFVKQRTLSLLKIDENHELLVQFPKYLTGRLKEHFLDNPAIKEVFAHHPLARPVFDIVIGAIDKRLEDEIKKAADNATQALLRNPNEAQQIIDKEAARLADAAPLNDSSLDLARIDRQIQQLNAQMDSIKKLTVELEQQARDVENVQKAAQYQEKIERSIQLLNCSVEENRRAAYEYLSSAGDYLTKSQVDRIRAVMDRKGSVQRLLLDETRYEDVPMRYYGAKALKGMSSPYVSEETKSLATNIVDRVESNAGRYTKPATPEIIVRSHI